MAKRRVYLLGFFTVGLLAFFSAQAEVYSFSPQNPPEALAHVGMLVGGYDGTITVSFLGDCTLGGESASANSKNGFVQTILREGMAYPLANLQSLMDADDLTIVNLEGVFTDRDLPKVKKKYNFKGPSSFASILTQGSVECVNLANNHILDYGPEGYQDTLQALKTEGVGYFGLDDVAIFEQDGVFIGLTGSLFSLTGSAKEVLRVQMATLKELGCDLIIHTLHGGEEYRKNPTSSQRSAARAAIEMGAGLVVGHHPHIVQGIELIDGVPVVYSLGNASFGGNRDPRDYDALLLQAQFSFQDGRALGVQLTLHPISVSGESRYNNYRPVLLGGDDADRVMEKLQSTSTVTLAPYQAGIGAVQDFIPYPR